MVDRETEIELYAEAGLPDWVPVNAKVGARYRRLWTQRVQEVNAEVCSAADLSPEQFEDRIIESDAIADVYRRAAERSGVVADPDYRSALARLLAAAFADDTRVSEVDHLTSQLVRLDPLHLRVLRSFFPSRTGTFIGSPYVSPHTLTLALSLDQESTAFAALRTLEAAGFAIQADDPEADETFEPRSYRATWVATHWGLRAMALCGETSG